MAVAAERSPTKGNTAILPASFGTTVSLVVKAIAYICRQLKKAAVTLELESASPGETYEN